MLPALSLMLALPRNIRIQPARVSSEAKKEADGRNSSV
jgi:hypothetical protein